MRPKASGPTVFTAGMLDVRRSCVGRASYRNADDATNALDSDVEASVGIECPSCGLKSFYICIIYLIIYKSQTNQQT